MCILLRQNNILEELDIGFNQMNINYDNLINFSDALKNNNSLITLKLEGNNIQDSGLNILIEALNVNISLKNLDLSNNIITDVGAKSIASILKNNNSLRSINLTNNNIGSSGIQDLIECLDKNTTLSILNVSFKLRRKFNNNNSIDYRNNFRNEAEYIGQTKPKTKKVIESAFGGVLFVDEAYRLNSESNNDFGKEAIEEIMSYMNNSKNANIIFIFAGYENEMKNFIETNPGLFRRITFELYLKDYTANDLAQIIYQKVLESKYSLSRDINVDWLSDLIENNVPKKLLSKMNGRFSSKVTEAAIEELNSTLSFDTRIELLNVIQLQHLKNAILKLSFLESNYLIFNKFYSYII